MRVVLVNQFYPPDTAPTGTYLHALACALVERGHGVTVIASRAAYNADHHYPARSVLDGVEVRRVRGLNLGRRHLLLKGLEYGSYLLQTACALKRVRADVALALTTPPFAGALVRACRRARIPYGHWVMDLYPDVLTAHGMLKTGSAGERCLAGLTRYALSGASFAAALAPDMAQHLARYAARCRIETVPLWLPAGLDVDAAAASELRRGRGWGKDETVFMYSGNMGLGHRFGEFLDAALECAAEPGVRWVFAGGGKRRETVEVFAAAHPRARIELRPYEAVERLGPHLLSADVHLMSLDKRWEGCMMPSKLQAVCGVARPILFVGSASSSMARWIRDHDAGWVAEADDQAAVRRAVSEARDPAERARRGAGAARLAKDVFDRGVNCERLCNLIEEAAHAV